MEDNNIILSIISNKNGQLGDDYNADDYKIAIFNKYNMSLPNRKQLIFVSNIENIEGDIDVLIKGKDDNDNPVELKYSEISSWKKVV